MLSAAVCKDKFAHMKSTKLHENKPLKDVFLFFTSNIVGPKHARL